MRLEPTTFESFVHCLLPIALTTLPAKVGGAGQNWLGFDLMQLNYWPCVIVCVGFGWFVGLTQSEISWSTIWSTYMLQCNEPSTLQLSNLGSLT